MRRVLLTGATGFLGRHVAIALRDAGFEVLAASRHGRLDLPGITPVAFNLMDEKATTATVERLQPTHLLHAAWDVTPGRYWTAPENLHWVAASLLLYRAFVAAGGQRFLGVGTCAEYDWTNAMLDEATTALIPATLYGTAKHALHQLLAKAATCDQTGFAWARVFFLYGPHEAPGRLIPAIVRPLLQGQPARLGDGLPERNFLHVADVAAALALVLASDYSGAINIATDHHHSIRAVAEEVAVQIGRPDLLRFAARPTPVGEPPQLIATGARLRKLGFAPHFTLASGLRHTIAWWKHRELADAEVGKPNDV